MKFGRGLFDGWLAGKRDDAVVGRTSEPDSCPIATCIKETLEGERINADYGSIVYMRKGGVRVYMTPNWASMLMRRIDATRKARITAGEVRELMKGLR